MQYLREKPFRAVDLFMFVSSPSREEYEFDAVGEGSTTTSSAEGNSGASED